MTKNRETDAIEQATTESNVDKIRDIIFGGQMKDYESRFKQLEERLVAESERLIKEMETRYQSLEKSLQHELEVKSRQLDEERSERLAALQEMDLALQSLNGALSGRLEELDTHNRKSMSDSRQEFHDEIAILQTRLREQHESLLKSIEEESSQLRDEKVSRHAMASLFTELSQRLDGGTDPTGND